MGTLLGVFFMFNRSTNFAKGFLPRSLADIKKVGGEKHDKINKC